MYNTSVKGLILTKILAFCLIGASVCCSSIISNVSLELNYNKTNPNNASLSTHSPYQSNRNQTSTNDYKEPSSPINGTANICKNPNCLKSADRILKTMDSSVQPCDDFYQYACGNWINSSIVPNDRLELNQFTQPIQDMLERFFEIVERETNESDKNTTEGKMRLFYKSCMKNRTPPAKLGSSRVLKPILGQQYKPTTRREQCLEIAMISFNQPFSLAYLKKIAHFKTDTKTVQDLIPHVKDEFIAIIKQTAWLDEETRKGAEAKVNNISHWINFDGELMNETSSEEAYKNLRIGPNFQANMRAFGQFFMHENEDIWGKRIEAMFRAIKMNPFYTEDDNTIHVSTEFIRAVHYDKARPNYLNFGTVGSAIGHEIGHALDESRRESDKDGKSTNWWGEEASRQFEERSKCLIDQYGKYLDPDSKMYVNGNLTLDENISDNLGFKIAFRAYNNWAKKNGEEPLLPGLTDLTPRQLFWVSTANMFCTKYDPYLLKQYLLENPHSPRKLRINGALSNIKEFSDTFNCPTGSPMNPITKCIVW